VIEARHAELLRQSAIPIPLAERAGVRSLCAADAEDAGFGVKAGAGLAFPYRDPATGAPIDGFVRLRLDHPNGTGRYRQPPWSRPRLYVPFASAGDLRDPQIEIVVVEGERKALSVAAWSERSRRHLIVIGIGGVWSWRRSIRGELPEGGLGKVDSQPIEDLDVIAWMGRRVAIVFDSDVLTNPDVARAERALARELEGRGAIVRVARIPSGPNGQKVGADDLLAQQGDDVMTAILNASQPATLPEIVITTDIPHVVDVAEDALLAAGGIYSRSRLLVEVSHDRARRLPWLARPVGAPALLVLDDARLRERMADTARWTVVNAKGNARPAMPPAWAAPTLAARPSWRFPEIAMVSETPMLRTDGSILESPGYDEATGVLLLLCETFPRVHEMPTRDDARAALAVLAEPFSDFPFAAPSDRSAVFAGILSLLARPAIHGPVPLFVAYANVQGSGKTLLADCIAIIGTGRAAPKTAAPADEAEASKRILSVMIEALPIVMLDNLVGTLRSPSLAAALTASEWSDRLLGQNKTVSLPQNTIWFITGNNVSFGSDLARRVIPIRLECKIERPEDRTGFSHPELRAYVLAERPRCVHAGLTILRAYHVARRPPHGHPLMGSFEAWDTLVRGALIWAGEPDPLEGRERMRAQADIESEALGAALEAWREAFGSEPITAASAVECARERPELLTALSEFARIDPAKLSGRSLGYALRGVASRILGGRSFERSDKTTRGATWWTVVNQA
jgi:uncharacterized protein DUF3854